MATVTVLKFPTADGARETLNRIDDLKTRHLIKLLDTMKDVKFEIIATSLSTEQEQKLREAFGQE